MGVLIKELLALPLLREARVLGGEHGVDEREARWIAVIEWPVEDFVSSGEIVLTTGVGCDTQMFERLAREIIDAGAAALCVSLHPGGQLAEVPRSVAELADSRALPLIALPWELRFADVMRAMTDLIIANQYAGTSNAADGLHISFTTALLEGRGLDAVAEALEQMLERPVLILDSDFQPAGHGRKARVALGSTGLEACWRAAMELPIDDMIALRQSLLAYRPRKVPEIAQLGLGPGVIVCAVAKSELLGYVYAFDASPGQGLPSLDERGLQHASIAVAFEMLRQRAVTQTEARIRGDFFWDLALSRTASRQEVATKAALLGCNLRDRYQVGVARCVESPARHEELLDLERTAQANAGTGVLTSLHANELLLLLPADERVLARLVETVRDESADGAAVNWGIAEGSCELADLAAGYEAASRALAVGHSLRGPGTVGDGAELAPFLMLSALGRDEHAIRTARQILAQVLEYDNQTSRDLIGTLEVFLYEHGNTSSSARRLHMNRHSLLYRLRKIEEMTGRSLDSHDDRFLLELSLKLLRFGNGAGADDPGRRST